MASGDLAGPAYGLIVVAYATLAFIKFNTDGLRDKLQSSVERYKEMWNSDHCNELKATLAQGDYEQLKILNKANDRVANYKADLNPPSRWDFIVLHLIVLVGAFVLSTEVLKNIVLTDNGSVHFTDMRQFFQLPWIITVIEWLEKICWVLIWTSARLLLFSYIIFILTFASLSKRTYLFRTKTRAMVKSAREDRVRLSTVVAAFRCNGNP